MHIHNEYAILGRPRSNVWICKTSNTPRHRSDVTHYAADASTTNREQLSGRYVVVTRQLIHEMFVNRYLLLTNITRMRSVHKYSSSLSLCYHRHSVIVDIVVKVAYLTVFCKVKISTMNSSLRVRWKISLCSKYGALIQISLFETLRYVVV